MFWQRKILGKFILRNDNTNYYFLQGFKMELNVWVLKCFGVHFRDQDQWPILNKWFIQTRMPITFQHQTQWSKTNQKYWEKNNPFSYENELITYKLLHKLCSWDGFPGGQRTVRSSSVPPGRSRNVKLKLVGFNCAYTWLMRISRMALIVWGEGKGGSFLS